MALDGGTLKAEATIDIKQAQDSAKQLIQTYDEIGKAAEAVPPVKVAVDGQTKQAADQAKAVIGDLSKAIKDVPQAKITADTSQAREAVNIFKSLVSRETASIRAVLDQTGIPAQVTSIKGFLKEAFSSFGGVETAIPGLSGALGVLTSGGFAAGIGLASAKLLEMGQEAKGTRRELQNLTGAAGQDLVGLVEQFHTLAGAVPESGHAVAQLTAVIRQQLHETGPALDETAQAILSLGRVMGGDLAARALQASGVFKAFGVSVDDQRSTLNALAAVSQKYGVDFSELADEIRAGAPLFKSLGLNEKEAAVFLGELEHAGVNTATAMVALRQGLGRAADAGGNARHDFENLFSLIRNAPNDVTAVAIAMENFGPRGGAALAQGIRAGTIALDDLGKKADELPDALETPFAKGETGAQKFKTELNHLQEAMVPVAEQMATTGSAFLGQLSEMGAGIDKFLQDPKTIQFIQVFMRTGAGAGAAAASFVGNVVAQEPPPAPPEGEAPGPLDQQKRPLGEGPLNDQDIQQIKEGTLAISDLVTQDQALSQANLNLQAPIQGATDSITIQKKAADEAAAAHKAYVLGLEELAVKGIAAGDGVGKLLDKMHGDPEATRFLLDFAQKTKNVQTAITTLTDTGIAAYISGLVVAAQQTDSLDEKQRLMSEAAALADAHLQAQADTQAKNAAAAQVLTQRYSQLASVGIPSLTAAQAQLVAGLQAVNEPAKAAAVALQGLGATQTEIDRAVQAGGSVLTDLVAHYQRLAASAEPVANAQRLIGESARSATDVILQALPVAEREWAKYRADRMDDASALKQIAASFGIDTSGFDAAIQGSGQQLADLKTKLQSVVDTADLGRNAFKIVEDASSSMLHTLEAGMPAATQAWLNHQAAVTSSAKVMEQVYVALGGSAQQWANMTIQQQQRVSQAMASAMTASETFQSTGRLLPAPQETDLLGPQHQQQQEDTARQQARQDQDLAVAARRLTEDRRQQDVDYQRSVANTFATYDDTLQSIQATEQTAVQHSVEAGTRAAADHFRTIQRQQEDFTRQQERMYRDQAQQDAETIRSFSESAGDLLAGATSRMNAAAGQAAQGLLGLSGGALAAGAAQLVDQFAGARQDAQDTANTINKAIDDAAQHLRDSFLQTNQQASDTIKGIRDSLTQGSKDVVSVFGQTFVQIGKATEFGPSPEATAWAASQARDQKILADNLAIAAQATQQQSILDTAAKARASIDADAAKTAQDLQQQILDTQKAAAKQRQEMIVQLVRMIETLQRQARDTLQQRGDQRLDTDIQQSRQNEDQQREWTRQVQALNQQILDAHNQAARARQDARDARDRTLAAQEEQRRLQEIQRRRQDEDLELQRRRQAEDRRIAQERERREIARAREQVRQGDALRRIASAIEAHPNPQQTFDIHDNALVDPAAQLMRRVAERWQQAAAAGVG